MKQLLLNCDLGEWESPAETAALIPLLDQANIACGGHAGDSDSIKRCIDLCDAHSTAAGMHPGLTGNRGRTSTTPNPEQLKKLLSKQYEIFTNAANRQPTHCKVHGSLYHLIESHESLRDTYLNFLKNTQLPVICIAGGSLAQHIDPSMCFEEAFLDRGYFSTTSLVPRGQAGDLITSEADIRQRILHVLRGQLISVDNRHFNINCSTLCVHSDTPHAARLLACARAAIDRLIC